MAVSSQSSPVTYFKRHRMQMDLTAPLPAVNLPDEFRWVAWEERLLDAHAEVKYQCFRDDLDGIVFPNLSNRIGCNRLMHEITSHPGFRPDATWLIAHDDRYVATVQGIRDRLGTGSIQNLGVIPAYRGHGLGRALLLQALHGFRRTGLVKATLEVTAQNHAAVHMYRQLGFRSRKTLYRMVETLTYPLEPDWSL